MDHDEMIRLKKMDYEGIIRFIHSHYFDEMTYTIDNLTDITEMIYDEVSWLVDVERIEVEEANGNGNAYVFFEHDKEDEETVYELFIIFTDPDGIIFAVSHHMEDILDRNRDSLMFLSSLIGKQVLPTEDTLEK